MLKCSWLEVDILDKKIVILYAALGGGHFKAAEAIKNYILENKPGCSVEMLDALKYANTHQNFGETYTN